MTAWARAGARRVTWGGTKAAALSGRSLRLWLGDLENAVFGTLPLGYRVQLGPERVLLTPLRGPLDMPGATDLVLARGRPGRRYLYLGSCRAVLHAAGIDPMGEPWVHLAYDSSGILLRPFELPPRDDLVARRVQRLRGDGRLWLGSLGALGIAHCCYQVVLQRTTVLLLPTLSSRSAQTIVLRGQTKHRYVYFTGPSHRHVLERAGLATKHGAWVLVDISLEMIAITRASSGAAIGKRRSAT